MCRVASVLPLSMTTSFHLTGGAEARQYPSSVRESTRSLFRVASSTVIWALCIFFQTPAQRSFSGFHTPEDHKAPAIRTDAIGTKAVDRNAGPSAATRAAHSWEYVDDRFSQTLRSAIKRAGERIFDDNQDFDRPTSMPTYSGPAKVTRLTCLLPTVLSDTCARRR